MAAGVPAAEMAAGYDTVWLDFTKGLGAPLGAVLCGSNEFIGQAWRWKQRLGGSMRQAGICAAACLHALDHHVDRLAEDHANARALARGLRQIPGVEVEEPDTNLVFFDTRGTGTSPEALQERLLARGIAVSGLGGRVRACTHLDVTAPMVEEAVAARRGDGEESTNMKAPTITAPVRVRITSSASGQRASYSSSTVSMPATLPHFRQWRRRLSTGRRHREPPRAAREGTRP